MPLTLVDRYNLVTDNVGFKGKVTAAIETAAIAAFTLAANPDTTIQAKRMVLAHEILENPEKWRVTFSWVVVTSTSMPTDPNQVTDAQIQTVVTTTFDAVAANLIPNPT